MGVLPIELVIYTNKTDEVADCQMSKEKETSPEGLGTLYR